MRRGFKIVSVALSVVLFGVFAQHSILKAADSKQNITVTPVKVVFELNAGEEASRKITVINNGDNAFDFKLYAEPFSVLGEEYTQAFAEAPNAPSAAKWISFPFKNFHINPGERIEAEYKIKVAADAPAGGHYATIFAQTIPPASSSSGVTTVKRIGTILYFEIKGNITRDGGVASFTSNRFQSAKPITSALRLYNSGNVHYPSNGTLTLTNVLNRKEYKESITGMILPSTTRKFERSWQNAKLLGLYKVSGNVEILGQRSELPAKWVVYLPLKQVLIVLALLAIIITTSVTLNKRKRKHHKLTDK